MTHSFTKTILMAGTAGLLLSLTACGGTTGGLAGATLQKSAQNAAVSEAAKAMTTSSGDTVVLAASQPGDGELSCEQIDTQITQLNLLIADNEQSILDAGGSLGESLATTAATEAAVRTGLVSKVPFGGSLLGSAMNAKKNADQQKIANAEATIEAANLRKSTLSGIHTGKGCAA